MKSTSKAPLNGVHRELFADGGLSGEGRFKDGKRHGKWTFYYKSGGLKAAGKYVNGELDGYSIRRRWADNVRSRMRVLAAFFIIGALCPSAAALATDVLSSTARLAELFEQDQSDRKGFPDTALSWKEINARDEARRREVLSMLKRGELRAAQDFFFSAVIFHHGQTNDHYRLATSLAWIAATMEPENKDYLWITASTWDRLMVKRGKPQWYGIQPKINDDGEREGLYPIDEGAVTDEERARFQVKSLAEIRALQNGSVRLEP